MVEISEIPDVKNVLDTCTCNDKYKSLEIIYANPDIPLVSSPNYRHLETKLGTRIS